MIAMLCMVAMMAACGESKKNEKLVKIAEEANAQCPISMGMIGDMTSIEFDGTDLVYTCTVDEEVVDLNVLEQNLDVAKQGALASVVNDNSAEFFKEVVEAKAGMKIVYKGKNSGKAVTLQFSPDELKNFVEKPADLMDPEALLEEQVKITDDQCPMEIEQGLVMESVTIEGSNVVYVCKTDENLLNMDQMEENREAVQAALEEYWYSSDLAIKKMVQFCQKAHKNVVYRYVGATSGKAVEFLIKL